MLMVHLIFLTFANFVSLYEKMSSTSPNVKGDRSNETIDGNPEVSVARNI